MGGVKNLDRTELDRVAGGMQSNNQSKCTYLVYKTTTVSLAVLMIIAAVEALIALDHVNEVTLIFVATYQIFFGLLILSFEMVEINSNLDYMLQRNFGFLYTRLGRPLFIIFVAFISFGLETTLGLVAGIVLLCFGLLQIGLFLKYPDVLEAINYEKSNTIIKSNTSTDIMSARI